jgi:hypothetical protein
MTSVIITKCFKTLLDLLSLLLILIILLLPLCLLLHILHLLILQSMFELLSPLLNVPLMYLFLFLDSLSEFLLFLCTLYPEILLSLILVQLVVVYPHSLCLILIIVTLSNLAHIRLRDWVFLSI